MAVKSRFGYGNRLAGSEMKRPASRAGRWKFALTTTSVDVSSRWWRWFCCFTQYPLTLLGELSTRDLQGSARLQEALGCRGLQTLTLLLFKQGLASFSLVDRADVGSPITRLAPGSGKALCFSEGAISRLTLSAITRA